MNLLQTFRTRSISTLGAFVTSTALLAAQGRGPAKVHYKYPPTTYLGGGVAEKDIDCNKAFIFPSEPNTLYATCDFLEEVDNNGTPICSMTDGMKPATTPAEIEKQKTLLSQALLDGLRHYAQQHKICKKQAGLKEIQVRMAFNPANLSPGQIKVQVDAIYGPGWEDSDDCSLKDVRNMCKPVLGIK